MHILLALTCCIAYCITSSISAAELSDLSSELQALVKQLDSDSDKDRKAAAKELGKLKEAAAPALPWIIKHLESEENVWVKKELRTASKRIGAEEDTEEEVEEDAQAGGAGVGGKDDNGYRVPLPSPEKPNGRIVYSPDGIGKGGTGSAKAKVEIKEMSGVKNNNKYMLIHLTGTEWSGHIINWAEFWTDSPLKISPDPKQYTHLVLRCLYLGRSGDINLNLALQVQEGQQSDFIRLSNYDPKHLLQKSANFVDIEIPIADFHRSMAEEDRSKWIWGIHIGVMSHQAEKDMGLLIKHIAFIKK